MIVVGCGVVREELEGISDDIFTTELDIELTEGDTASKGSQSLPRLTAVNRGVLSCGSREVQNIECVPQTELLDLQETFYINLMEQLQPLPCIFRMNAAQTVFRKT